VTQRLDVVIPIYNEQDVLPELCARVQAACDGLEDIDWRVIFVNDGSADDTLKMLLERRKSQPRFTVVDLSRNFGHQAAISAGLAQVDADAVIIIDGDLQDPPELFADLVDEWRKGTQVVLAVRRSRQETGLRRLGFDAFHVFFQWISDFPFDAQTGVFGLLDRRAVRELNLLSERNRFIPGLRAWIGFKQGKVFYDRMERAAGQPKQTLTRLMRYAADGIFSFSYKPLRLMTTLGVCISTVGFLLALLFVFKRLLGIETAETGFTTLVTLILFLGGIQLIAIGLLGEYLGRVYDESKQRPLYIIERYYKD